MKVPSQGRGKQAWLMNQTNPSRKTTSVWQNIEEIMLPVSSNDSDAILSLLEEMLGPLQLPVGLIDRIVKSVQEVAGRAMMGGLRMERIYLSVFVPANYGILRGTWGFFRIERINAGDDNNSPSYAVDLYLYPEAG
jgi:hypothetical protein